MKTFKELGLSNEVVATLLKLGIKTPTEIQEKTIPIVLTGRDVIGGSATGSGKTLAFASNIIEKLEKNKGVQALILTPTRELAEQVADSIIKFSEHKKLNVLSIYGGVSINTQIRKLANTDIVVGTPGRILDHMRRNTLKLNKIKFLVLDEVDRIFDMGFQKDVTMILDQCPKKRQTMLFSATISPEMDYLARKYTQNPAEVSVKSHIDPSLLKQIYYNVADGLKFSLFVYLLKKEKANLVMVFCGTRRNVDFVANNLNHLGINAKAIHGGMIQTKRNKVMSEFNSKKGVNVLVCTDVAARGLDIKGVSHVYNYDLPKTSSEYIHRIGRTARAGKEGIAINVLCSRDYENFGNILMDEKLKIKEVKTPWFEKVRIIVPERKNFSRQSNGRSFNKRQNNGGRNFNKDSSQRQSNQRGNFNRGTRSNFNKRSNSRQSNQRGNFNRGPRTSSNRHSRRSENNYSKNRSSSSRQGKRKSYSRVRAYK